MKVMFNLSQIDQASELWRVGFEKMCKLNREGAQLKAQVAGRSIGIMMSFAGTAHPFALKPSWLQLKDAPWSEKRAALQKPEFRQRLLEEKAVYVGEFEKFVTETYGKIFPTSAGYEPDARDSPCARGARKLLGRTSRHGTFGRERLQGMLYFPLFNYSNGNLDVLKTLHSSEHTLMGLSDAGAHCGAICDGGMPTFMLTHWTRDREDGFSLEHIVSRQTQQTAAQFGLFDRGMIKVLRLT